MTSQVAQTGHLCKGTEITFFLVFHVSSAILKSTEELGRRLNQGRNSIFLTTMNLYGVIII